MPPRNVSALQRAFRMMAATNEEGSRLQLIAANVVAGQFLRGAVMRGGASLKLRYGNEATRWTIDFDASRSISEDEFVEVYAERLREGWNGFSGRIVKMPKAHPRAIPGEYVMQPFEIKLTYNNRPWCTVPFELSYNEVGDADNFDLIDLPPGVLEIFAKLGLPAPAPFPLMKIAHQVAQKLHGLTDPNSVRAQDLIDLQLILSREQVDLTETREICRRLFANRQRQSWPPHFVADSTEWALAYERQRGTLPVLPTISEAVAWANELIERIERAAK